MIRFLIYDTGMVYAAQGKRAEALEIIKELEEMSGANLSQAHWIAKIYATLNEKELAFSWLERAVSYGERSQSFTKTSRCADSISYGFALRPTSWGARGFAQ